MWAGIHHNGRTALVRVSGVLNAQVYRDEVLRHHVVPLITVTGDIFQHGNVRPHTARVGLECLQHNNVMSSNDQQDRQIYPQYNTAGTVGID